MLIVCIAWVDDHVVYAAILARFVKLPSTHAHLTPLLDRSSPSYAYVLPIIVYFLFLGILIKMKLFCLVSDVSLVRDANVPTNKNETAF